MLSLSVAVSADLGNFNDYDSGGSSDWGGSDSWSSDSDWGGSPGYVYYGDDDDYEGGGFSDLFAAIVIVVVIFIIFIYKNGGKGGSGTNSGGSVTQSGANTYIPNNTEEIINAIKAIDESYNNNEFIAWVKETFITLQSAWSERDFEKCRYFEKEELFEQHMALIKQYIESGKINVLDRICINNCYLYKYVRENGYEHLSVCINARMTDYIIDEKTKSVLKGNPNTEYNLKYIYTFSRKAGVQTALAGGNNEIACPHCGAPTKITSAGKCEYCGFIIKTGDYSWVLSDIVAVKQGFTPDGGGVIIR